MEQHNVRPSDARASKLRALLTPAIKECRLVSVCPPTARPPPITCTRQPRRAPFSGRFAHSLCATNLNCKASRKHSFDLTRVTLTFSKNDLAAIGPSLTLRDV